MGWREWLGLETRSSVVIYGCRGPTAILNSGVRRRSCGNDPSRGRQLGDCFWSVGSWIRFGVCETGHLLTRALSPEVLASIGRGLVRYGEVVFCLEVDIDEVKMIQASSWDVEGNYDPATWIYNLELPGPSGSVSKRIGSAGVVHLRYASFPQTPWKGISPVSWASQDRESWPETWRLDMGQEAGGVVGHLLPVPTDGGIGRRRRSTLSTERRFEDSWTESW